MRRCITLGLLIGCVACGGRPALPKPQFPLTPTDARLALAPPKLEAEPGPAGLPTLRSFNLANGLKVVVLERHLWPHASIGFISTRGGEDGADLEASGLASIVAQLVVSAGLKPPDDGAAADPKAATQAQPPDEPDALWISVEPLTFQHAAGLSTQVRSRDVGAALASMADHVQHLTLDRAALLRARRSVKSDLSEGRDTLEGIARNHLMQRLYGPSHTLGQHAKMAMERADKHELEAVIAGYKARFVPRASALVIAGDVNTEEVVAKVNALFGTWQRDEQPPAQYAPPTWRPQGKRKVFLHASSARQALIALGQLAPAPSAADYIPFRALVHILGGSASSRLSVALREEQGATYHVGARLSPRRDGSTLLIETATARDAAESAVPRIVSEMSRLQEELVSDAELRRAKLALVAEIASDFATDEAAMLTVAHLLSLGRDPTAAQRDLTAVLALTPETLRDAARRTLQPTTAPVIVVGNLTGYGKLGKWAQADDEMLP